MNLNKLHWNDTELFETAPAEYNSKPTTCLDYTQNAVLSVNSSQQSSPAGCDVNYKTTCRTVSGETGYIYTSNDAITVSAGTTNSPALQPSVNPANNTFTVAGSGFEQDSTGILSYNNLNISISSTESKSQFIAGADTSSITVTADDSINNFFAANVDSNNLVLGGALAGNSNYRIDNISLRAIDAEKTGVDDTEFCWAATASNMLYWAGWGKNTGSITVRIEDDLLDYYKSYFTDAPGYMDSALEWFFTGKYNNHGNPKAPKLKQEGGGGFFKSVTFSNYYKDDSNAITVMDSIVNSLKAGDICGLGVAWERDGGHAITCWGYSYNASISSSDRNYYTGVWISDSDDDYGKGRNAPDIIRYCPINWNNTKNGYMLTYKADTYGFMDEMVGLKRIFTINVYDSVAGEKVQNGTQTVFSGGSTFDNIIGSAGRQILASGGVTSGSVIGSGGSQLVSSGGIANAATVNAYGLQNIYTGGVANSTLVNSGVQYASGGTANGTTVSKGGQVIYTGGIASGAVINSGTWQGISSGGVARTTTLNAGWQYLYTGGMASATTVNSAGCQIISSGGNASGTTINSGGQIISSGGTAAATTINAGASQIIKGLTNGATVNAGIQFVSSGGSASGTAVNLNGKMQIYSGGMANGTTLAGGIQNIYSGGVASITNVNLNGKQVVYSGGTADSARVNYGGSMFVSSGGVANSTTLAGGSQNIYAGGIANETNVNLNGRMYLFSGGTANGATINAYGLQHIYRGGVANSTLVNAGNQYVSSGGTANDTMVSKGGQVIYSSGIASGAVINSGTWQGVSSGGVANTTTLNAGWQYLYTGGVASATTVNSGGCQIIFSGATASSTVVNSGGQIISSGGTANTATINAGASQIIKGLTNGATVNAGIQFVSSGGSASGTVVNLNGKMQVYSGGRANSTTLSGGIQNIYSGGQASGTIVNLNGKQIIYSGGTADSAIVNSGGSVFVSSGGILSGSLTIDGGHVTVAYSNNMQTPTVSFKLATAQVNDAILVIQTGVTGDVSGSTFNLNIDNTATGSYILADGANLTSMSSVTFSVTDNGQNVDMQVGTSYTFADGDHLSLSFSDSTRDKLIAAFTNNPPAAPPPIVFNLNAEIVAAITFDNAKIVDSVQQTGWVSLAGNDDDYRFDLASPVTGGILRLHDLTGGNADLSLYNASGTLLQSSNNTGTLEDSIISNLAAGTYFARVNAVSGNIDYKLDFDKKYVTGMLAS